MKLSPFKILNEREDNVGILSKDYLSIVITCNFPPVKINSTERK
jgi:hypothetical protein